MLRLFTFIFLIILGLVSYSWIYIVCLFAVSIFFRNFWMGIAAGIILDIAYTWSGVGFSCVYILLGVGAFAVSYFAYNMTRWGDSKEK